MAAERSDVFDKKVQEHHSERHNEATELSQKMWSEIDTATSRGQRPPTEHHSEVLDFSTGDLYKDVDDAGSPQTHHRHEYFPDGGDAGQHPADAQPADSGRDVPPPSDTGVGQHIENNFPEHERDVHAPSVLYLPPERIDRDIAPGTHRAQAGETTESIARARAGQGASEEQVQAYCREIESANGLTGHPERLRPGNELTLPGHTADGGYVALDPSGNRQTRWEDGTVRQENTDHTGYVRRHHGDGSDTTHHWGPEPHDNYDVIRTRDNHWQIRENGQPPREVTGHDDIRVERARLEQHLDGGGFANSADAARFREDMRRFEHRTPPVPDAEIARTYDQVSRLMEHQGDHPLNYADRDRIAMQVMHQAANPNTIDQGYHNTCGAATAEARMYTRNPSEAARIVAEAATTGQITTHDTPPRTIPLDERSLRARREETPVDTADGDRSHASQVFQVAYNSVAVDRESNGRSHYEQRTPHSGHNPPDTGERIVSNTNHHDSHRFRGIGTTSLETTYQSLTGRHDEIQTHHDPTHGPGGVASEAELNQRLRDAQANHNMPMIIAVDGRNEPWYRDGGHGTAGGSADWHYVTVTEFHEGNPPTVSIDNQWGDGHDRTAEGQRLSTHDLYQSMIPHDSPEATANLRRDVEYNRAHNQVDAYKELELARLEHINNDIGRHQFDDRVVHAMRDARQRWATEGERYPGERQRTEEKYESILSIMRHNDMRRRAVSVQSRVDAA